MNPSLHPLARLALTLAAATVLHPAISAQTPVFEARFNDAADMDLQNGAVLSTGVSGLKNDSSYLGEPSKASGGPKGPLASAAANHPADAMDEFTITVWYKVRQAPRNDATLFDLLGTLLIWEDKSSQWILRIDARPPGDAKPPAYWFRSGDQPQSGGWANSNEWYFLAMVWKKSDKKVVFFQGGKSAATVAKETTRPEDVESLKERPDALRIVGNCAGKANDRPFDGCIDNLRFYPTALSDAAIEKIRQADLKNKTPALP